MNTTPGLDGAVFIPPPEVGQYPAGDWSCDGPSLTIIQPVPTDTPWGIAIAQEQCVCGAGRFADEYDADLVPCAPNP